MGVDRTWEALKNLLNIFHTKQSHKDNKTCVSLAEKFLTSTVQEDRLRPNSRQDAKAKHPAAPRSASLISWKYCCCCCCCCTSSLRTATVTGSRQLFWPCLYAESNNYSARPWSLFVQRCTASESSSQPPGSSSTHPSQKLNMAQSQLQSDLDSEQMRCSGLTPDLVPHLLKGHILRHPPNTRLCWEEISLSVSVSDLHWFTPIDVMHHLLWVCTCMFPLDDCWGFL